MKVITSPEVAEVVRDQGGRLYVWPRKGRCCMHGLAWLEVGSEPKQGWSFERQPVEGFELHLARMGRVPDELHLGVKGRRRKGVAAYWDDCAWIV